MSGVRWEGKVMKVGMERRRREGKIKEEKEEKEGSLWCLCLAGGEKRVVLDVMMEKKEKEGKIGKEEGEKESDACVWHELVKKRC